MPNDTRYRLRNPALLMSLALAYPLAGQAATGASIDFAAGSVVAVNAAGAQRPLTKGSEVANGDTIRTGEGGRAQIRFSDGALMSLQPQTEFRVDNYQFSGKADGEEKGFFSLLKGGLRTITGLVGRSNRDNYKVSTNVATIGIRGTEYSAMLDAIANALNVATGEGMVEVCNGAGCVQLGAGEAGRVVGGNAPQRTESKPQLPPAAGGPPSDVQPVFVSGNQGLGDALQPLTGINTYSTVYAMTTWCCVSGPEFDHHIGTGEINSSGVLIDFKTANGPTQPDLANGSVAVSLGNDGLVAWGFWVSGASGFAGGLSGGEGGDILHYVVGLPTTDSQAALGGSSGTYTLAGPALATSTSSDAGVITSASMNVNFTAAQVNSLAIGVSMNSGYAYTINDSGIPITGFGTGANFASASASVNGTGGACASGGCSSGVIKGAFFGAGAPRAGVGFTFNDNGSTVSGAAPLKK